MHHHLRRLRAGLVAISAIALSAGLAMAANPEAAAWGRANASTQAGKIVPVRAGQVARVDHTTEAGDDIDDALEDTDDEPAEEPDREELEAPDGRDDEVDGEGGGTNCATDPTGLAAEEIASLKRGSVVCWAAHQDTWPEEFKNHGQWVKSWAHLGKQTETGTTDEAADEDGTSEAAGKGRAGEKVKKAPKGKGPKGR